MFLSVEISGRSWRPKVGEFPSHSQRSKVRFWRTRQNYCATCTLPNLFLFCLKHLNSSRRVKCSSRLRRCPYAECSDLYSNGHFSSQVLQCKNCRATLGNRGKNDSSSDLHILRMNDGMINKSGTMSNFYQCPHETVYSIMLHHRLSTEKMTE